MNQGQPQRDGGGDRHLVESASYETVTVIIKEALNERSFKNWIYRGCFVTVSLPTASTKTYRTKTVYNFRNPKWDEEITYRFPHNVEHFLEIKIYAVSFLRTILMATIWVNPYITHIRKMKPGSEKNSKLVLNINTSNGNKAEVFECHSNSIVVAAPLTDLDVTLEKPLENVTDKLLNINGSYQESQTISLKKPKKLRFYINGQLETDLEVKECNWSRWKILCRDFQFVMGIVTFMLGYPVFTLTILLKNLYEGQYSLPGFFHCLKYPMIIGWKLWKEPHYRVLLKLVLAGVRDAQDRMKESNTDASETVAAVQLDPFPQNNKEKVSLKIGKDMVDLDLEKNEREKEKLDVRMDFDIPLEEKAFLKKRKDVVAKALQKLPGCGCPLQPDQVPTIAVVASGGGTRAMTGLYGGLKGLQDMGVLSTVSYITGVSGSTWTMSSLYSDPDWSKQDLDKFINDEKVQITKKLSSVSSKEKTAYYAKQIEEKKKAGHLYSLSDLAGLVLEHIIFGKETDHKLSDQRKAVTEGQNPLPIYTAVNKKEDTTKGELLSQSEWCEFTPYEVGLLKYGAFVRTEDFGSHFFLGHLVDKLPELRIPYLIGMWSSAYSISVKELLDLISGPASNSSESEDDSNETPTPQESEEESEETPTPQESEGGEEDKGTSSSLIVKQPDSLLTRFHFDLMATRLFVTEIFNYMRGLFMHRNYGKDPRFMLYKGTQEQELTEVENLDSYPNELTPSDPTMRLVDAGLAINIGCAPILRQERMADLIIILSYSYDKDPLEVVKLTSKYCEDHKIPFPKVDENQPKQEAYVFKDDDEPTTPIVIHFPLVNVSFRDYKAPGVRRTTEKEKEAGRLDAKRYKTMNLLYNRKQFESLVNLTHYNVMNNKEKVLDVIQDAVQRKRERHT